MLTSDVGLTVYEEYERESYSQLEEQIARLPGDRLLPQQAPYTTVYCKKITRKFGDMYLNEVNYKQ